MDLVSIITPAYNAAEYITETIDSVLKQTYKNWELIIVDDCSTDYTYKLISIEAKKDNRIKIIKQKYNLGVAAARNLGLSTAKGKYIAFLDSDDIWHESKLEKQLNFMKKNKYVFSYTYYQKFDSSTGRLGKIMKAPKYMTADMIYYNTAIGCLTVMIDKEVVGTFKMPIINHTEDNITWQNILKNGYKAYCLAEVLAFYREGNKSLTSNKIKSALLQWKTYRGYYSFSIIKSMYYFLFYSLNAILRHK